MLVMVLAMVLVLVFVLPWSLIWSKFGYGLWFWSRCLLFGLVSLVKLALDLSLDVDCGLRRCRGRCLNLDVDVVGFLLLLFGLWS
jgi:hypothetical protein